VHVLYLNKPSSDVREKAAVQGKWLTEKQLNEEPTLKSFQQSAFLTDEGRVLQHHDHKAAIWIWNTAASDLVIYSSLLHGVLIAV